MAIQEGAREATRADMAQTLTIAQRQREQLEHGQAGFFRDQRWSHARALVAPLAELRAWIGDLERYRDLLPAASETVVDVDAWLRVGGTVTRAYDDAMTAAVERPAPATYLQADRAWRALVTFRADAFAATTHASFHPAGSPLTPSVHPALQTVALQRNPRDARPAVDRSSWQHLMSAE